MGEPFRLVGERRAARKYHNKPVDLSDLPSLDPDIPQRDDLRPGDPAGSGYMESQQQQAARDWLRMTLSDNPDAWAQAWEARRLQGSMYNLAMLVTCCPDHADAYQGMVCPDFVRDWNRRYTSARRLLADYGITGPVATNLSRALGVTVGRIRRGEGHAMQRETRRGLAD